MVNRNNSAASLLFLDDLKISSNPEEKLEVVFQFLLLLQLQILFCSDLQRFYFII